MVSEPLTVTGAAWARAPGASRQSAERDAIFPIHEAISFSVR